MSIQFAANHFADGHPQNLNLLDEMFLACCSTSLHGIDSATVCGPVWNKQQELVNHSKAHMEHVPRPTCKLDTAVLVSANDKQLQMAPILHPIAARKHD